VHPPPPPKSSNIVEECPKQQHKSIVHIITNPISTYGSFDTILEESVSQLCCEVGCCGDTVNNSAFVFPPIDANDVVVVIVTVSPTSQPTHKLPTTKKPIMRPGITKPTMKSATKKPNPSHQQN
jgi:hypothetical protein